MSELSARRELKRIMNYGIPKHVAEDIIDVVAYLVQQKNNVCTEFIINYAIDIVYGLRLTQKKMEG